MADLSSIFDWIAGLLFAGAIGMTALTHKEIKYARLVVRVATIMFIVRWGAWALMSKQSWVIKATVGACVGAFVFGAIPPALNWIRSKSIDQPTVPPEAKTLDLYLRVESVVFGGYGETSNEPYAVTVFLTITNPDSVPRLFARWEFFCKQNGVMHDAQFHIGNIIFDSYRDGKPVEIMYKESDLNIGEDCSSNSFWRSYPRISIWIVLRDRQQ